MSNPLKGYGAGIRRETLLGWVAWYGISEPEVEYDELKQRVTDLGLDVQSMPGPIRPGDAFKRACRYAQASRLPLSDDTYANVLIRKVTQSNDVLEWHMVVETVDPDGKRLSYDEAARLIFRKREYKVKLTYKARNNRIVSGENVFFTAEDASAYRKEVEDDTTIPEDAELKTEILNDPKLIVERTGWSQQRDVRRIVDEAEDRFREEFDHAMKYLDAQTIRQTVRRQMDLMRAFLLRRNGSVYFIPRDQEDKAVAMCALLDWIGRGSGFHILPLIDTEKQREMIQAAFEDEVHESAQAMLNVLAEAIHNKEPLTFSKWSEMLDAKESLIARAREYSDLIEREFAKAGTELALLDDTMSDVFTKGLIKPERGSK